MLFCVPPPSRPGACVAGLAWVGLALFPGTPCASARPPQEPAPPAEFSRAEDLTDSGLAFVQLVLAREHVLVGEPFEIRLRLGLEAEFLRTNLVQRFQRPLELPVQVFAPALEDQEGLRYLDALERDPGVSFALGERITRATRAPDLTREGHTFAVFEFERRVQALRPGALELRAPVLAFAHATRFEDDFLQGRRALDRRDALVRGPPARLTIEPPPGEGQPAEFTGAIGSFTLDATATPQDLELGQGLELALCIASTGAAADLAQCGAPRLELPAWLHLRGTLVEREPGRLTARYDLVPLLDGAHELPAVRFAYYSTTPPAGYRMLATLPIPIVVRSRAGAHEPTHAVDVPASGGSPAGPPVPMLLLAVVTAVTLLGLGLALRARRRAP